MPISAAAVWLRSASLRTSEATTAKPLPCSPARAASTAAFSASRSVWRAISCTMVIFSAMVCIAVTARVTASPLACASVADWRAIFSVWLALSAFCLMLAAICSIDADASSAGRGLLGRALRQLLGARRQFLAAGGDVVRRAHRVAHHLAQLLQHPLQRDAERVLVGQAVGLDRQIAVGDRIGDLGRRAQIGRHAFHRDAERVLVRRAAGYRRKGRRRRSCQRSWPLPEGWWSYASARSRAYPCRTAAGRPWKDRRRRCIGDPRCRAKIGRHTLHGDAERVPVGEALGTSIG